VVYFDFDKGLCFQGAEQISEATQVTGFFFALAVVALESPLCFSERCWSYRRKEPISPDYHCCFRASICC
jgi:hypothetical protein